MYDILQLLECLSPLMSTTTQRHLGLIISALLSMSGRVTMLGLSRWTGKGGSYRSIQRFFYTDICWPTMLWLFFRQQCWGRHETYLLVGDEVVVTKSGHHTHGLGRFFSSLYSQPVSGLAFFGLSLVSLEERRAFPIRIEQVMPPPQCPKASQSQGSQSRGRPKGSKNKDKTAVSLNRELLQIKGMLTAVFDLMLGTLSPTHLALDGHFGNNYAVQMAHRVGLQLVSKLRHDSVLYLPYTGAKGNRKYGERLHPKQMDPQFLMDCSIDEGINTEIYQVHNALHRQFAAALNVVIIVKTNLTTKAQAHVILFSSDETLPFQKVMDYYALRFQIEFNFREAKQFWGLEDFMNITQTAVTNAVNLSFLMVNVSHRLLKDARQDHYDCSILDLKASCRAFRYVEEVFNWLPQKPDPISWAQILSKVANLGAVHPRHSTERCS